VTLRARWVTLLSRRAVYRRVEPAALSEQATWQPRPPSAPLQRSVPPPRAAAESESLPGAAPASPTAGGDAGTATQKDANRIGWEIAHANVSRRPPISPLHDCSPCSHVHVRQECLGFVHRSRTIACRAVPNLSVTIRNLSLAGAGWAVAQRQPRAGGGGAAAELVVESHDATFLTGNQLTVLSRLFPPPSRVRLRLLHRTADDSSSSSSNNNNNNNNNSGGGGSCLLACQPEGAAADVELGRVVLVHLSHDRDLIEEGARPTPLRPSARPRPRLSSRQPCSSDAPPPTVHVAPHWSGPSRSLQRPKDGVSDGARLPQTRWCHSPLYPCRAPSSSRVPPRSNSCLWQR
jgi:hypothetical protein